MINLRNDYCGIAHPEVLKKLVQNANNTYVGYGLDEHSENAKNLIRKYFNCKSADVHFLTGGTITNKVLISHFLAPYEAVICADSGHINVHETGTIEESGHKILTVPNYNGKIKCEDILKIIDKHTDEHMVIPKMVYITNSTEIGSIYTYQELKEISHFCKKNNLYLYLDGARLGTALASKNNDIKPSDYSKLCDAFYIGGTKNGLILGEALVIVNNDFKKEFRYSIKHFGGMYAKGFVNGLQFEALFENNLFMEIASYENKLAEILYEGLRKLNVKFASPQETNQIFPIFPNEIVEKLKKYIMFEIWDVNKDTTTIRFVTHYLLKESEVQNVLQIVKGLL